MSSEEIDTIFWNAAAPGRPTEGVEEFLDYLKEQEIRTGVISNISYAGSVVENRIKNIFPKHDFEFILSTSEYMYRKPNKRIFQLALEKADLKPESVWFVGDQYECDMIGAKNAGIYPIWYIGAIDMPYKENNNIYTINHWEELRKHLQA